MKKITLTLSAFSALALSALCARAEAVYSANVVGYTKIAVKPNGLAMLGVQFQKVGGGAIAINDLFTEAEPGTFGADGTGVTADSLQMWNAETQSYQQYWFADWQGAYGAEYDRLWYPMGRDDVPSEDLMPPGVAAWYRSQSTTEASVLFAGEVVSTDMIIGLKGAPNITMFANPFPMPLSLSDVSDGGTVDWVGTELSGEETSDLSDTLQVWNAQTQSYQQYWFADWQGAYGTEYDRKWYPLGRDDEPTTDSIPVGGSAWFVPKATVSDVELLLPAPALD